MSDLTDFEIAKLIIKHELAQEIHKKRDSGHWGSMSEAVAACLLHIDGEIDKKFNLLHEGKNIREILPHLKSKKDWDSPDTK